MSEKVVIIIISSEREINFFQGLRIGQSYSSFERWSVVGGEIDLRIFYVRQFR